MPVYTVKKYRQFSRKSSICRQTVSLEKLRCEKVSSTELLVYGRFLEISGQKFLTVYFTMTPHFFTSSVVEERTILQ
jgi:hypothetical protein